MNILILYATLEGQTAKIAGHIAQALRNKNHKVTFETVKQLPGDFAHDAFDAVILGGSIHMGHYPRYLSRFVKKNREWLDSIPTAFFTVCMAINSQHDEARQEAIEYSKRFMRETRWQPTVNATFAGAVKYTQYNFITRLIMKRISQKEGGNTDTAHDHEYTDWEAVARFAEHFTEKLSETQPA